jgi:hypothetical protein
MKLKQMVGVLGGVCLLLSSAGFYAQARETVVFGVDRMGNAVSIPREVCIQPGQGLRLLADGLDAFGNRMFMVPQTFDWTYVGPGYPPVSYRPGIVGGIPQPPFYADALSYEIVYLFPGDPGRTARLEVQGQGFLPTYLFLSNPASANRCQWARGDVYVNQTPAQPGAPGPVRPCFNRCITGVYCTDGCPYGAVCDIIMSPRPLWHIRSCY